ncbi:hypothetical protein AMAG_11587 [Allomyces macrogynus ATCC 38327]|uniref:Ceramidase n=1 Tax=Allomyces macrogynus (strain ATCC 38327) TaxID=578462 RepID=A0A0L0SVP1_ALLM3|nr:hypothetical protein AMAG_11587 [Allomyces macrogynus ATCC 38327]|eukprot:KNE66450.1 hypothetical protein AMAG_11587 [Allomyces macrogynus ATCC 38327]
MQPQHAHDTLAATHHPWVTDALVDWCEANFHVVWFVAEFWNTVSNLWIVAFGILGMLYCRWYSYEPRFTVAYFSIVLVGVGSSLFHGSLTYHMQLLDELPMLFGTAAMIYCCLTPHRAFPPLWATIIVVAYPIVSTAIYLANRNAEFFQIAYTLQVVFITALTARNGRVFTDPAPTASKTALRISAKAGPALRWQGLAAYGFGTALWVVDNVYCYSHLVPLKEAVGSPWAVLLELHAWWHALTGYGSFCSLTYMVAVRMQARADEGAVKDRDVALLWWGPLVPYVVWGEDARRAVVEKGGKKAKSE